MIEGKMDQNIGRYVDTQNYINLIRCAIFPEIAFQNLTVKRLVTVHLILVFQFIAYLFIRIFVEGLDDYGIFRRQLKS